MADFKPITEWTRAELIAAAQERGTGMDPIYDEMLRRLKVTGTDTAARSVARNLGVSIAAARRALKNIPSN